MRNEYTYLMRWIYVFKNANMRVWWFEHTCAMMRKHIFNNIKIRVWWNEYAYLIMGKYGFDNVRIRARWIGPLRLAGCKLGISWLDVDILRSVCNVFILCMLRVRKTKVWFLACKKGVFALQKYGFWFLNVMLLQIVRTHFVVECGYFAECSPYYSNSLAALWQTVSSRRGPIYRACISVNVHKMGDRSACVVIWIYVF